MLKPNYHSDTDYSSFVFIIGGPFQGKSLLSIKVAERYAFSGVLSTDVFRNILRIQNATDAILCSTSQLTNEIFNKQREEVSELVYNTLHFYADRQETLVMEGVHFSKDFLSFAIQNGAKCVCLDNQIPWEQKVDLKRITTPITRVIDKETGNESYVKHTDDLDVDDISYTHKEKEYNGLHEIVSLDANLLGIDKVSYMDIEEGFTKICSILDKKFGIDHKYKKQH